MAANAAPRHRRGAGGAALQFHRHGLELVVVHDDRLDAGIAIGHEQRLPLRTAAALSEVLRGLGGAHHPILAESQLPIGDDNHDFAPYAYAIYFNTVFLCVL